jgi:hypothetical protein
VARSPYGGKAHTGHGGRLQPGVLALDVSPQEPHVRKALPAALHGTRRPPDSVGHGDVSRQLRGHAKRVPTSGKRTAQGLLLGRPGAVGCNAHAVHNGHRAVPIPTGVRGCRPHLMVRRRRGEKRRHFRVLHLPIDGPLGKARCDEETWCLMTLLHIGWPSRVALPPLSNRSREAWGDDATAPHLPLPASTCTSLSGMASTSPCSLTRFVSAWRR